MPADSVENNTKMVENWVAILRKSTKSSCKVKKGRKDRKNKELSYNNKIKSAQVNKLNTSPLKKSNPKKQKRLKKLTKNFIKMKI